MKIGEKLRRVCLLDEVINRRARLKAISYLFKTDTDTRIEWHPHYSGKAGVCLWHHGCGDSGYSYIMDSFTMKPLCDYPENALPSLPS